MIGQTKLVNRISFFVDVDALDITYHCTFDVARIIDDRMFIAKLSPRYLLLYVKHIFNVFIHFIFIT